MATLRTDTPVETIKLDRESVDRVIAKLEALIHEGNIRRVIVKDRTGATIIEAPLTLGVVGVALAPVWAAIAAIAGLATDFTIELEKLG